MQSTTRGAGAERGDGRPPVPVGPAGGGRRGACGALVLGGTVLAGVLAAPPSEAVTRWRAVDTRVGSGLPTGTETWEAAPVDVDVDGDQDVWIGYHDNGAALYRNRGDGTYRRMSTSAWPVATERGTVDRHSCDWADVDGNGLPDSYCSTGRTDFNYVKTGRDNELWLQTTVGRFVDVGTRWGLGDVCGRGRYVAFLRVNGDARPDLFVGNDPPRADPGDPCDDPAAGLTDESSKLFLNRAGTGFVRSTTYAGGATVHGGNRCAEVADIDRDGRDDLLTCGLPGHQLYRGTGTGLVDVTARWGVTGNNSDAAFGDLDGDGDLDLVTASWTTFAYWRNTGSSFRPPVTIGAVPAGAVARSVALGDADGDGDLDVYGLTTARTTGAANPRDSVYLNAGLAFTQVPVPAATGAGDVVTSLDGDGDGRTEFLVLNGREVAGPVQRIELVAG